MRLRVLVVVTHLLGAGHLVRAAALSRALAAAGHETVLVSGGLPNHLVGSGPARLVQLPPVRAAVGAFARLLDAEGRDVGDPHLARRRDALLAAAAELRPDVVVTELYPFGRRVLAAEFGALVEAVAGRARLVASVRDILAAPGKAARVAASHDVLRAAYAAVLVHGDPALVPLDASWPLDEGTRAKLVYTGYLDAGEPALPPAGPESGSILVSGGSSAAALPLYSVALDAAAILSDRPWRILAGAGVDEGDFAALARAAPGHVVVERARPDFRRMLREAAVLVGQAGYNTVMDIVATRSRSVLCPFETGGETEQRLRAEHLSARGWATLLPSDDLNPETLAAAVAAEAARPRPDLGSIRLDDGARAVAAIERVAA